MENTKPKTTATYKELANKLEPRLKFLANFKIGKTGQKIKDKYNQEYRDKYEYYEEIGYSATAENIDEFEIFLLNRYHSLSNCDNYPTAGEDMRKSKRYIVYIVFNI